MGILTDQSVSWVEAAPAFLVACALLFLPGLATLLMARVGTVLAAALAPLLSTGYLVAVGVLCGQLGVQWSPAVAVLALIVIALLAGLVGRRMSRGSPRRRTGLVLPTAAGMLLAGAVVVQSMRGAISSPTLFPQQPDTIFHLGAAQWMLNTGDISVLHAAAFGLPSGVGFYPAAFHDFTATTALLSGTSVVVATTVCVVAMAALVWPLGCVALALMVFRDRPLVALVTPVLSVSFTGFPFLLMGAGVLWPNLFGQALLPAALALVLVATGSARSRRVLGDRALAGVMLLVAVPAVIAAHPNAFVALCLITGLILLCRLPGAVAAARHAGRARSAVADVAAMVAIAGVALVALYVRPSSMFNNGSVGPQYPALTALRQTLLFGAGNSASLPVLSLLVVIGAVVILMARPGARWIVLTLATMLVLFWLNLAVDSRLVRFFTWPWYNVGTRLQAVAVLAAVLTSVAAIVFLIDRLRPLLRFPGGRTVAVLAVTGAFLAGTGFAYVQPHRQTLRHYFEPAAKASWATPAELRSLRSLATHLPENAVVAANPWRGGTYLYIVSGRRLLVPTEKANTSSDRQLLSLHLDEVGTDRTVCAAAERQHVDWALTGGSPNSRAGKRSAAYRGIDDVAQSPAWKRVATSAPYSLYQRVQCAR